jgi:hypothetical protein
MSTEPSPQDDATMVELKEQRNKWFIRGIFNKLGHASFDLYLFEQSMYFVDVPWEIWSCEPGAAVDEEKTALAAEPEGLSALKNTVVEGTRRFFESFSSDPVSKPDQKSKRRPHISAALRAQVEAEIRDKVTMTYFPIFGGGGDYPYFPGAQGGDRPPVAADADKPRAQEKHLPGPLQSLPATAPGGKAKGEDLANSNANAPDAQGE